MKKLAIRISVICGLFTIPASMSAASLSDLFSSLDANTVISSVASSITNSTTSSSSSSTTTSSSSSSDKAGEVVSSLLSTAVSAVTGTSATSASTFVGTWNYTQPAVELSTDNTLSNIAMNMATSSLETKLQEYLSKIGIEAGIFNYIFNSDGTFSNQLKSMTLEGSYTYDASTNKITFNYQVKKVLTVTSLTADVSLSGSNLSLLFEAEKLLSFLNSISELSDNSTYQTIMSAIGSYESLKMGYQLTKQ